MSKVIRKERCPKCAEQGKDRSGNNLAVYDDGHKYCYGCGWIDYGHNSTAWMHKKLYKTKTSSDPYEFDLDNVTHNIPPEPRKWLNSYGLSLDEIKTHRIYYDLQKSYLVFPVYDGERLVHITGRYFGSNPKHPKYITKGWKSGYFKIVKPKEPSDVYVLVEDHISAIKVGRHYNAVPLLGCFVPHELVLSLMRFSPRLRIWLDPDKIREGIRQAAVSRQLVKDCGTIIADKDPKDYNDDEIKRIVSATLSGNIESPTQQG